MSDAARDRPDCLAIGSYSRCHRYRTTSKTIGRQTLRNTRPWPRTTHDGSASVPTKCVHLVGFPVAKSSEASVPIPEELQFFRDLPDQKFQETLQPQTQRRIPMREPRSMCSSLFRPFPEEGHRPPKN